MRNKSTTFFTRIALVILAALFFLQMPASARQLTADDLLDHFVYLPLVLKNYSDHSSGTGNISGYVKDARSGVVLEGAEVCYQDTICDTTGIDGRYTLSNIESGGKTFTAAAIGYGKGTEYIFVVSDNTETLDFNLLENLDDGEIRVVLTWDATRIWGDNIPNDLNLHMWTDYADPDNHIFIDNIGNCQDLESPPYACYEKDATFGSGPDTIILYNNDDDFSFAVLNQNSSWAGVPPITQLSARVQVFDSGSENAIADYFVPTTGQGDLWYVFDYLGGVTELRNCIVSYPIGGLPPPVCP